MRTLYTILSRQFDHLVLYHSANFGNEADMLKSCPDFSFRVAWIRTSINVAFRFSSQTYCGNKEKHP